MLNFTTDSKNLYCTGGYFFRKFAGRSFRQKIILILLVTAVLFGAAAVSAATDQRTRPIVVSGRKSAVTQQANKRSIGHIPKLTLQHKLETIASMGKTYKPVKGIRPKNLNCRKLRSSAHKFMEVEIAVSNQFNIEYISALPRAPGGDLQIMDSGRHVRVQLVASQVQALIKKGADIVVLRKFVLVEGLKGGEATRRKGNTATLESCSGPYCYGSNGSNVSIPDDGYDGEWVFSDISISCAPSGAIVSCIDVHYEIIHAYVSDLIVVLSDYNVTDMYVLWLNEGGGANNINETETGITTFNGKIVNQIWTLWATDDYLQDSGHIDYWWIKVYYETCTPPANDECVDAIAVTENVPYFGSSVCATGGYESTCSFNDTADVWHKFTPSSSGNYTISLRDSGFDTTLVVFDYCGGLELVCDDDISYPSNVQSEVTIDLNGGNTYYIRVAGYNGETGSYKLLVEDCPAPANDDCEDSILVAEGVFYSGSTACATGTYESSCSTGDTADVWYSYTPSSTGTATISLSGSAFDTTLTVFDECGGTELACNDDISYPSNIQSEIMMTVVGAQTYLIRIAGFDGDTGNYTLTVTRTPCVLPDEPNSPIPVNGASNVPVNTILSWNNSEEKAFQAKNNRDAMSPSKDVTMPKVIYGEDDRREECEVDDPNILSVGDSTVALVLKSDLTDNGDGTFSLPTETYAEWYERVDPIGTGNPLCLDEPYRDQPKPAFCSGFLVAPDIIATAGHCESAYSCVEMAFIFGFVMDGLNCNVPVLTIDESEIYYCNEVVASTSLGSDWALIRLDREVVGHNPLRVRVAGAVDNGEPLLAVGHPVGLPRKYAEGAEVKSNNVLSPEFEANLDTYMGNSGGPVFDANTLVVEGILVSGNPDFVQDGSCDRSKVCPNEGCPTWEGVTRTTEFTPLFPSWAIYDVYFGATNPLTELVCSDLDEPICDPYDPCGTDGTLKPDMTYYWQVVAKNSCNDSNGAIWSFTTAPAPIVTGWEIAATHGELGEIWCPIEDEYVEPRTCGISKLCVCFDQAMNTDINDPNVISIEGEDNGTQPHPCSIEWDGSNCLIITLCSALPEQDAYTVTVGTEVESSAGCALGGDRNICVTALKGDANGNREVNAQDLLAIRAHAVEPVDCNNARYDINCSGAINAQDMLAARQYAENWAPACPSGGPQ